MDSVEVITVLLLIATAVAMAVKWIKVPYSIALVIVGLLIGVFQIIPRVEMTPELILLVCLPPLLFEASWNLNLDLLKQNWKPIAVLATIGVIISMSVTACILHYFAHVSLQYAFLFGAMIAATDPISVLAVFKKMGVSKRLTILLEGESLFNDGTAVVLFKLVLMVVLAGAVNSYSLLAFDFVKVIVGGILIGCLIGYLASNITKYFEDHLLEIMLTTIAAYGAFILAEQMHVSPVLSVVAAGIVIGNYGSYNHMSASTRLAVNSFWEYAAFIVESLVFLLIGLQVKWELLVENLPLIGIAIGAILLARLVVVYGLSPFLSTKQLPISYAWRHILFWGALRGSLSMALALSLPANLDMKEQIVILIFGVVLFTLLIPGLTIEPLINLLGLKKISPKVNEYQLLRAKLIAIKASLSALESLHHGNSISHHVYEKLKKQALEEQDKIKADIEDLHLANASIEHMQVYQASKQMLESRKDSLISLAKKEGVNQNLIADLIVEIDQQIDGLTYTANNADTQLDKTTNLEKSEDVV